MNGSVQFLRLNEITLNLAIVTHIETNGLNWTFKFGGAAAKTLTTDQQTELHAAYQFDDDTGQFFHKAPPAPGEQAGETEQ